MKKNLLRIFYLLILLTTYNLASSQYKVPDYVQNWNSSEPTVLSQDIEGGAQQVANIAARDAIPEAKRKIGMIVSYELTGEWMAEMYIGTDVLNANWTNPNNWQNIESDNPDVDTLKANVIVLGGSEPVDNIITIKDAVNEEQFDSIHVDTAHVDHELFVRDTNIVELIETHGAGKPGGAFGDIQYNNSGVFDGAPMTTDGTDMTVNNSLYSDHVEINNSTSGSGLSLNNTSDGYGMILANSNIGYGLLLANESTGEGINFTNSGGGTGIYYNNTNGTGIAMFNTSSSYGIGLSNSSTGIGIQLTNSSSGKCLFITGTGSGDNLEIRNTGTGNSLKITDTGTDVFTVDRYGTTEIAGVTNIGPDSLTTTTKIVSKQYAGQIYQNTGTTVTIGATGTDYTIDEYVTGLNENVTLTDSSITIGSMGFGVYHFMFTAEVTYTTNNADLTFQVFVNDVTSGTIITGFQNDNTGSEYAISITGIGYGNPGDVVKVKVQATATGTLSIIRSNIHIIRN